MNSEFFDALELLEKEKGIPKEYMLERVEAALISAFKREMGGQSNVRVHIDAVKKDVKMYQQMNVVETVEDDTFTILICIASTLNPLPVVPPICPSSTQFCHPIFLTCI